MHVVVAGLHFCCFWKPVGQQIAAGCSRCCCLAAVQCQPINSLMQDGCISRSIRSKAASAKTAESSSDATATSSAWADILHFLDNLLMKLKDNYVPQPLVQALFKQLFHFMDVQLFNQMMFSFKSCTPSHGEQVLTGLSQVGAA